MNHTYSRMTAKEKHDFETRFYTLWAKFIPYPDDRDNVQPFRWGHPWKWCPDETVESAEDFFSYHKDSILKICKTLEYQGWYKRIQERNTQCN